MSHGPSTDLIVRDTGSIGEASPLVAWTIIHSSAL